MPKGVNKNSFLQSRPWNMCPQSLQIKFICSKRRKTKISADFLRYFFFGGKMPCGSPKRLSGALFSAENMLYRKISADFFDSPRIGGGMAGSASPLGKRP